MHDIKARVDEFRKMAAFADQLEDAGDDRRAQAVRIALYDRVVETGKLVQAKIAEKFGDEDGMTRAASTDGNDEMKREAINWGNLWKGIKGLGSGLWSAIRGKNLSKGVGQAVDDAAVAAKMGTATPGQKAMDWMLGPDPQEGRLLRHVGGGQYAATPLGRGLAIGAPAALGIGGAAALAGRGRGPEQRPDGGLPPLAPGGYPGGPATLPPSGMPGGPMGGGGGMGGGGPMGSGGYGGMSGGSSDISQAMSAIQGVQSKIAELEGRIARLEGVGR